MSTLQVETGRANVAPLEFQRVAHLEGIQPALIHSAIKVYQLAFAGPPYFELFSDEAVMETMHRLTQADADLILGLKKGSAISLAGGYLRPDGVYYIDELAVDPAFQGCGYGRQTLTQLLTLSKERAPTQHEIRTGLHNFKAIRLYESLGFEQEKGCEIVSNRRQDNRLGLDERIYLARPPLSVEERLNTLKRVAVAYPSGNTTAVVFDQLLDADRKALNTKIMDSWKNQRPSKAEIEQCCFVTLPKHPQSVARVEMFGGEFCANATRSVIQLITDGQDYAGHIEVSGVKNPLEFNVKDQVVTLQMPLPATGSLITIVDEGTLVFLDGITHLVVTDTAGKPSPRELFNALRQENKYDCTSYPAFGISYYDAETNKADFCVWVKAVDTVFDETACGSGTCSIGVATASLAKKSVELEIIQPSGESIRTLAHCNRLGLIEKSFISGRVEILHQGAFKIG